MSGEDRAERLLRIISEATAELSRLPELRRSSEQLFNGPAVSVARRVRWARQQRAHHFDPKLFRDPAWDMLLDLYVAQADGREISVSSACLASGAPGTTGLRWLTRLEEAGLVQRHRDLIDQRLTYVRLTTDCIGRIEAVFERTARE
jgi:hypothetical protein